MDNKTVLVVTPEGIGEIKNPNCQLSIDAKRALVLVDNQSTVEVLARRAPPSLRIRLASVLQELLDTGFIQEKCDAMLDYALKIATPQKIVAEKFEALDFTNKQKTFTPTNESREFLAVEKMKGEETKAEYIEAQTRTLAAAKLATEDVRLKVAQESDAFKEKQKNGQIRIDAEEKKRTVSEVTQEAKTLSIVSNQKAESAHSKPTQETARFGTRTKNKLDATSPELLAARQQAERVRTELAAANKNKNS